MLGLPSYLWAEDSLIEDFKFNRIRGSSSLQSRMGGVSTGEIEFIELNGDAYARMTGNVSIQNNGGFIQFRMKLTKPSVLVPSL